MGLKDFFKGNSAAGVASESIKEVFKGGLDILDEVIVNDEERIAAKANFVQKATDSLVKGQQVVSDRHSSDMQSDNRLSKSVRPLSLVFLLIMFTLISVADGNLSSFAMKETYITIYKELLALVFAFYFGGRSIEKGMKMVQNFKSRKEIRKEGKDSK